MIVLILYNFRGVWVPRVKGSKAGVLSRVTSVSPKNTDVYAIRLLLMTIPGPKSFIDLRTVDGVVYESFVDAAQKRGLLEGRFLMEYIANFLSKN
jgi:hypothetical protein